MLLQLDSGVKTWTEFHRALYVAMKLGLLTKCNLNRKMEVEALPAPGGVTLGAHPWISVTFPSPTAPVKQGVPAVAAF